MAYRIIVLPTAETDMEKLDPPVRRRALRRPVWLQENATLIVHHRMSNLPEDLAGLCRLRVGDLRILYWVYAQRELIKVYRVQHRREVYEDL